MLHLAGVEENFKHGYQMAMDTILSGRAIEKFETIAKLTN